MPLPQGWVLRPARHSEQVTIKQLISQNRLNPIGLDWRRFRVVTDSEGAVQGCGQVKLHRDGSWELASIVVAERWRGKGIGSILVEHLIGSHDRPLWLMCRSGMAAWYVQFGFREVAAAENQPRYFKRVRSFVKAWDLLASSEDRLAIMVCMG